MLPEMSIQPIGSLADHSCQCDISHAKQYAHLEPSHKHNRRALINKEDAENEEAEVKRSIMRDLKCPKGEAEEV
jgi:hypothetical protein